MFPFQCPECSRKSLSAGRPHCLYCRNDEGVLPAEPELAASRDTEVASGSRNHVVSNDMQIGSKVVVHKRMRKESSDRLITDNIQAHKQWKEEISKLSDQVVSPSCKPGNRNPDFMPETSAARIYMASDNSHSTSVHHELINFVESHSYNQGMQELGNLGKGRHLTVSQNIASNISILQISQNNNPPGKISDSGVSMVENLFSSNDTPVVSGSYDLGENENAPNLPGEKLQSRNPLKIQFVVLRDEKLFTCRVCGDGHDKHTKILGGRNHYFCCVCTYKTRKKVHLEIHRDIHCPKKICNVCSKEYTEGYSHDSEHICNVCEKKLQCKTLLDQHSLDHEEYFLTHCWVCSRTIDDHFIDKKGKNRYVCCVCRHETSNMTNLQKHINKHRPKLFCRVCREEYPIEENNLHGNKCICIVCQKKFQCLTLLEQHSVYHKEYFSSYCRVCKGEISEHEIEHEVKKKFQCCECLLKCNNKWHLLDHLRIHTVLRLFKCDVCGRRFVQYRGLRIHSQSCIPLPYKCEICRARFPSSDSLDTHRLKKHKQTLEESSV